MDSDDAYSGQEAIDLIKERIRREQDVYKLILTDINMPGMDGIQMSKIITNILNLCCTSPINRENETKIYAVTAMNEQFI
jgi:CheY-like chemotaxis protein